MQAYKGVLRNGVVVLQEGVHLPEGVVVTVTVSEVALLRARMRVALIRNLPRRTRVRIPEAPTVWSRVWPRSRWSRRPSAT